MIRCSNVMVPAPTPEFSLIVPTRWRVARFRRLLDSLHENAADPDSIEVIAVVDDDDTESLAFSYAALAYRCIAVPPGRTMGELNLAGYNAASGRYLMLLNDDVVVRTPG